MASQAAIDGIGRFGIGWRKEIRLSPYTKIIGNANDNGIEDKDQADAVTAACHSIATRIKAFLENAPQEIKDGFDSVEEDIEALAEIDVHVELEAGLEPLEEINDRLNSIYDELDYYRILAK